jgi:serine/threonine protein kinase
MDKVSALACPDRETLSNFLVTAGNAESTLVCHIDTCSDCQCTLEELSNPESLNSLRPHARQGTDLSHGLDLPKSAGDIGSISDIAIESVIGRGGMGDVFRGRDEKLGRIVAIKILARGSSQQSDIRFEREAKALARLDHPNIVSIYSTGRLADGRPWLCMPFIDGRSLKEKIDNEKINARDAATIVKQVCDGLAVAHEAGLLHRDVKPANILLDLKSGSPRLADFGLARTIDSEALTRIDVVCGTPEYMSPEQITDANAFDQRSDIYSLGITLYEVLTGTAPFRGPPIQVLEQHRNSEPIPPKNLRPSIPVDLQNICLMAMAREPNRRYQSATEFSDDLQRFLSGKPVRARETSRLQRLWLWSRRNRALACLAATSIVLLLLLTTGSTIAAWRLNSANQQLTKQKLRAQSAEKLAISDRTAAINALDNLVRSVYGDLTNDAASIKTREHVANAAIDGLKSLTEVEGDRRKDRSVYLAHLHIADLSSIKGDAASAESNYQSAIEIADVIAEVDSDNMESRMDLARAFAKYSQHLTRMGDSRAITLTDKCVSLLEDIISKNSDSADAKILWLVMQGQKLELIRQANPANPELIIEKGNAILANPLSAPAGKSAKSERQHALFDLNFIIGRSLLESYSAVEAEHHFDQARQQLDLVRAEMPNNVQIQIQSATLDRAHAMALGSQGKLTEAIEFFQSAIDIQTHLAATHPDDFAQKTNLANTRLIFAMAYQYAGNIDRAIELSKAAIDDYREIVASNPKGFSTKLLLVNALFKLANAQLLANRWDEAHSSISEARRIFSQCEADQQMQGLTDHYRPLLKVFGETLIRLDGEQPAEPTATGECLSLLWIARRDALIGESFTLSEQAKKLISIISPTFTGDTFDELFAYLKSIDGVDAPFSAQILLFEANVYGILTSNIHDPKLADQALQRCLHAINEFAIANPVSASDAILNDPDLINVRKTDEFKTFWAELQNPTTSN